MTVAFIGDAHGKFSIYHKIAQTFEFTVQVGDFGFGQAWNNLNYSGLNLKNHKVIGGNHDNYDMCIHSQAYLDYGQHSLGGLDFFVVRGGLSIDRVYRVGEELSGGKKTWWSQEEMNFDEMMDCMEMYADMKPDILVSHAPSSSIIPQITSHKGSNILQRFKFHYGFMENTSRFIGKLLTIHRPKLCIAGHHHCSYTLNDGQTEFRGLDELEVFVL